MTRSFLLFSSLLICVACSGQSGQPDQVKIATIPFPVLWDKKPVSFKAEGNSVKVVAGKETDLYCFVDGNYYVNTAPKMIFTPDSNFVLSAKISPQFKSMYDGGAILLYSDEQNWAKLLFEMHEDGTFGLGSSKVTNKSGEDSYHLIIPNKEVYVRFARSGRIFNFYYSLDGKAWKVLRTFSYNKLENMRIGFYAQSPRGESCTVDFTNITYRGEKFKDYFTGE